MDERKAIARLKRGDIRGLETLVHLHQVTAIRTAFLITRDRPLAEDIVQSAFIRVYERIAQFDEARSFAPWFLRIVANDATKAASRMRRVGPLENMHDERGHESERWADAQLGPDIMAEAAETRAEVWSAMARLSPTQREAVVLRYYLELDVDDVAERLGMAGGTAKWHLHAARKRLAGLLDAFRPGREMTNDMLTEEVEVEMGGR